ncbi:hypothetical protein AB0K74_35355 [Streptomyces sp. NPDC056159]|uniref:hypothetical protein n=1 Tax=Streptomyces sp. NPDC056159 TaxID=3155537 RepID=UPI0034438E48
MEAQVRDYGFSPTQQDEIWKRWREGQSFSLMGRALGAPMHHVLRFLDQSGGVRQAPRQRSKRHLLSVGQRAVLDSLLTVPLGPSPVVHARASSQPASSSRTSAKSRQPPGWPASEHASARSPTTTSGTAGRRDAVPGDLWDRTPVPLLSRGTTIGLGDQTVCEIGVRAT